ncbi:unnamed protein product [Ectocarpus fasciculatus]
MGCQASKQASLSGEIRSEELAKCAAVSGEVRWVWLRSRSLFSFGELRSLFKQYQAALLSPQQQPGELQYQDLLGASQPAPVCSVEAIKGGAAPSCGGGGGGAPGSAMSKAQFLSLCESSDAFRLSEVVGAFGSRLFDVLDANGVGFLEFETFVLGLSKLLKGPEKERLKLLYSAYDLSGVAPSEERRKSSESSGGSSSLSGGNTAGGGGGVGGGKAKPSRRSKYLTVEDITTVLASASQAAAYPALLSCTTDGKGGMTTGYLSGGGVTGGGGGGGTGGGGGMFCCSCCWCCSGCNGEGCSGGGTGAGAGAGGGDNDRGLLGGGGCKRGTEKSPRGGEEGGLRSNQDSLRNSGEEGKEACGGGGGSSSSSSCGSGRSSRRGSGARVSRDPEALAELLREMARRNAERYAAAAVSEFGRTQGGAGLTQKEFEKWALTGPVLRCRINEFSIDLNLAPFQGVRLW